MTPTVVKEEIDDTSAGAGAGAGSAGAGAKGSTSASQAAGPRAEGEVYVDKGLRRMRPGKIGKVSALERGSLVMMA